MKKLILTFCAVLIASMALNAQKLKQNGDLTFLKGESHVNVEITFDENMTIGRKNMSEAAYIEKSMEEREAKEFGSGNRWLEGWQGAREKHYIPKFVEMLNKAVGKNAAFGDYPDATYTVVFNVTRMEPGFNIGVTSKPAEIDGVAYFVRTEDKGSSLADVSITRAPGSQVMGMDFAVEQRMAESFAIAGKRLGALLKKKALK